MTMDSSNGNTEDVSAQIAALTGDILDKFDPNVGLGSMSCNVYDSAWVACVSRPGDIQHELLFPATLDYVLSAQLPSGCFQAHPGTEAEVGPSSDNILSTLAALFLLQRITNGQLRSPRDHEHIESRASQARTWLAKALKSIELDQTAGVGFEVLLPALLELVESDDNKFDFPTRTILYQTRDHKMSKIKPEMLYGTTPSALLHSLEAFYGREDFDFNRVKHHKVSGNIMGSPSATAAYLMRCTEWDEEAEAYLHSAIFNGAGKGTGGVPSAFPSTNFEILWVFSTILHAGVPVSVLGPERCKSALDILDTESKLVGFAQGIEPDLDDSAKASSLRCLLGKSGSSARITERFARDSHYATYPGERNASLTANCNALVALLLDEPADEVNISKIAHCLCDTWWSSPGVPKDKWNRSPWYTCMLFSQALVLLLRVWQDGKMPSLSETFVQERVLLCLFQCFIRILHGQHEDGSWNRSAEQTAYCIIALAELSCLPCLTSFKQEIEEIIARGRQFFDTATSATESLWIEKVSFGSPFLHRAYVLAAKSVVTHRTQVGPEPSNEPTEMKKALKLAEMLPLFKDKPKWLLTASWIESRLYLPQLQSLRDSVFEREGMSEDKYFSWIPFFWTAASNINGSCMSAEFLLDMMVLSFLNYQADEFMEVVVAGQFGDQLDEVRRAVDGLFESAAENGDVNGHPDSNPEQNKDMAKITSNLRRYIDWVMHHPHIQNATKDEKSRLQTQLRAFLHAHISQAEDNQAFASQKSDSQVFHSARQDYRTWVRTTSAQHTSCPFSFEFVICLTSAQQAQKPPLESIEQRYLASDLCDHLATMCRMYNDIGSLRRDRQEQNLNSLNFPDFHPPGKGEASDEELKARLFRLAGNERKCLELAIDELRGVVREDFMKVMRVFVDITDLFGQMYVVKDIASTRTS